MIARAGANPPAIRYWDYLTQSDFMNGRTLTLGLLGIVAAAGLVSKRGSASERDAQAAMRGVLRDFLFGGRVEELSERDHEAIIAESDAYGVGKSAPLGDWSAVRDSSPTSIRVMFRILSEAVGPKQINQALRDRMDAETPPGQFALLLKLTKKNARSYVVEKTPYGDMVIADFHPKEGRFILFLRDKLVFRFDREATTSTGPYAILSDIGSPMGPGVRSRWPDVAHRAYDEVILPRRLGAKFPTLAPIQGEIVDGRTGLRTKLPTIRPNADDRILAGHPTPPEGEQVPHVYWLSEEAPPPMSGYQPSMS